MQPPRERRLPLRRGDQDFNQFRHSGQQLDGFHIQIQGMRDDPDAGAPDDVRVGVLVALRVDQAPLLGMAAIAGSRLNE